MIITAMAATDADADEEMIAGIPGTSGGTKRRAGNMASMSGAVKEINEYILFWSICLLTIFFFFKMFGTSGGTKRHAGNIPKSKVNNNLYTELKFGIQTSNKSRQLNK